MNATSFTLACVAAAMVASGCTVKKSETPGLTGPSEFALSVAVMASPDTLVAGSTQQAAVSIQAHDASGAPKANQAFRLYLQPGAESGSLSTTSVVTGTDGRATAIYTMPTFSPFMAGTPPRRVAIVAQPIGTDFNTAVQHTAAVQVVPPPSPSAAGSPKPALQSSLSTAKVGQVVTFDASLSEASAGSSLIYYYWNFGDTLPNDEHGPDASHAWAAAGTYLVVLGVEDSAGRIASTFKTIVVTP
jgi:hypothetical protein